MGDGMDGGWVHQCWIISSVCPRRENRPCQSPGCSRSTPAALGVSVDPGPTQPPEPRVPSVCTCQPGSGLAAPAKGAQVMHTAEHERGRSCTCVMLAGLCPSQLSCGRVRAGVRMWECARVLHSCAATARVHEGLLVGGHLCACLGVRGSCWGGYCWEQGGGDYRGPPGTFPGWLPAQASVGFGRAAQAQGPSVSR